MSYGTACHAEIVPPHQTTVGLPSAEHFHQGEHCRSLWVCTLYTIIVVFNSRYKWICVCVFGNVQVFLCYCVFWEPQLSQTVAASLLSAGSVQAISGLTIRGFPLRCKCLLTWCGWSFVERSRGVPWVAMCATPTGFLERTIAKCKITAVRTVIQG